MRTTAFQNIKGGVGKSTTVINVAAILAENGRRVLAIDADPQANLTQFFLGTEAAETVDNTMAQLLDVYAAGRSCDAEDYLHETAIPGIQIVPSSIDLIDADIASVRDGGAIRAVRDLLDALCEGEEEPPYDNILIDCPPSFTAASVAALYAADDVVIPVEADLFSIMGLSTLVKQIGSMRSVQPRIRIAGALITKQHNTPACIQGECALRASAVPVFRQTIRRSDKVTESIFAGRSLQAYSPQSAAGRDYRAFVDEFLELGEVR